MFGCRSTSIKQSRPVVMLRKMAAGSMAQYGLALPRLRLRVKRDGPAFCDSSLHAHDRGAPGQAAPEAAKQETVAGDTRPERMASCKAKGILAALVLP